jgi:5-(carboxyamino)imidazole ribonucleotide synthase
MILQPGQTIGVVGGGQLGRMFVVEARRAGYRVVVFTDEPPGSPAGQVADFEINAPYTDRAAAEDFARRVAVATYEFENIPAWFLAQLEEFGVPVRPGRPALETCQNREKEKNFFRLLGIPCAPFRVVDSLDGLREAVAAIGAPCVLKSADGGYDGKGQVKIRDAAQVDEAWMSLGVPRGVLEAWIDHKMEISVVAARGADGDFAAFPPAENEHRRHILDTTLMPARIDPETSAEALELSRRIAEALEYVGVLAVEYFLAADGRLLANEVAPRPHNSGHCTIDACSVSQFGQQLRAITGQPLAAPKLLSPVVMVNLLGEVWPAEGAPDWSPVLGDPRARLHLYGKRLPRRGRKMGHFCVLDADIAAALASARAIKDQLDRAGRV